MKKSQAQAKIVQIYILCFALAGAVLSVDLLIPLGVAGGVPYIAVVLVSLWASQNKGTLVFALLCSLLTIAGYYLSPPGGELWKVLFNRSLAIFAIWVTAILGLQRIKTEKKRLIAVEESEKALNDLKAIKGLLPICASCKSIRNDDGYWQELEGYMQEHSDAEFSHSICPECTERLYPEVVKRHK